ncbi:hypothetical protein [uncultured Maribacter sp.]|uniref:hypothetical protein n=1 Tax=uncultured Maribacter sp. TaxID=431308 RepID=UPI00260C7CE3|nr:hypothetical protein [uncultured Maribacter sp.]
MNSEDLAKNIKTLLVQQHKNYFSTLNNATTGFKDPYWLAGQKVFNSMNEENKEDLKAFIQMCIVDTATEILAPASARL